MSSNLQKQIEEFQNKYYDENGKNSIFKKSQKKDLAKKISNNFDINLLLNETCYTFDELNVIIDYNKFKLFASSDNYKIITRDILSKFTNSIKKFDSFQCHLNLDSFTISAAERHKEMIEEFCKQCLGNNNFFSEKLTTIYIYYPPSLIENIAKLFSNLISPIVKDKVIFYTKQESDEYWNLINKL